MLEQPISNSGASSLTKYYRRPKVSLKLPTNGLWYSPDVIELNENAVVNILPMTGLDEIKAQTPELVSDANFKFDLIKSCCPVIKKPEELKQVDVLALMFGIYSATYGKNYKAKTICPHCLEKYSKLSSEEAKKLAVENKDVIIKEQTFELPADKIIEMEKICTDKNYVVELEGLKLHLQPIDVKIVNEYTTTSFYQDMLEDRIRLLTEEANNGDKEKEEVIKLIQSEVKKYSDKIYNIILEMIINSIEYIEILETGEKIYNRNELSEFIKNSPHDIIEKIRKARDEYFDDLGIPSTVKVECNACHELIDVDTVVFDPTSFFDTAS